jgi:hypothetical protein
VLINNSYGGFAVKPEIFAIYQERGGLASSNMDDGILRNDLIMIQLFKEFGSKAVSGDSACLSLYQSDKDYTNFYTIREDQGIEEVEIHEADYMREQIRCIIDGEDKSPLQKLEEIRKL